METMKVMEQVLFRMNSLKLPFSLSATAIFCPGVWDKGGDGAGSVPDEQPEVLYSLSITVISCQDVWEKGGDGAGFVPDEQPKVTVQLQPFFVQVSETKEVMEQALFRINSLEIQLECNTELTADQRERYQQELHTLKKGIDQHFKNRRRQNLKFYFMCIGCHRNRFCGHRYILVQQC
jgi:hypothetical protein